VKFFHHHPSQSSVINQFLSFLSPLHTELTYLFRAWVTTRARAYILQCFNGLVAARHQAHDIEVNTIHQNAAYYRLRPDPRILAELDATLQHDIDDDWRQSVRRYPEVLDYFYGLVDLNLPDDRSEAVRNPPLEARRKKSRRQSIAVGQEPVGVMPGGQLRLERQMSSRRRHSAIQMPPMPPIDGRITPIIPGNPPSAPAPPQMSGGGGGGYGPTPMMPGVQHLAAGFTPQYQQRRWT
jgi:hypothetical protein